MSKSQYTLERREIIAKESLVGNAHYSSCKISKNACEAFAKT